MAFDDLTFDRDGQLVYAMDGTTPAWQPEPGSRFEVWSHQTRKWETCSMIDALMAPSFRYVVPDGARAVGF